ncbi:hypothetical protein SPHINGO391_70027 [Sphingomonas aurantiaca]|uniref:Uncharacterized protein n=1 Tax=Sphingomonas aurantiaca TaxID=185949 RepID=A0A5E8AMY2_9SPHN|nr:hypothetical protein SPHINGO391_70027 [Sphingomonas aurantiaca]
MISAYRDYVAQSTLLADQGPELTALGARRVRHVSHRDRCSLNMILARHCVRAACGTTTLTGRPATHSPHIFWNPRPASPAHQSRDRIFAALPLRRSRRIRCDLD